MSEPKLTEAERETIGWAIERDWQQRVPGSDWDDTFVRVEATLRDRLADLQESNVALLQRVADLTAERVFDRCVKHAATRVRDGDCAICDLELMEARAEAAERARDLLDEAAVLAPLVEQARQEGAREALRAAAELTEDEVSAAVRYADLRCQAAHPRRWSTVTEQRVACLSCKEAGVRKVRAERAATLGSDRG